MDCTWFLPHCRCMLLGCRYWRYYAKTERAFLFDLICRSTCRCENALKLSLICAGNSTLLLLHENLCEYSSFLTFTFRRKCSIMSVRNAIASRPRMHNGHLFLRSIKLMISFLTRGSVAVVAFLYDFGSIEGCCFFCIFSQMSQNYQQIIDK